MTTIAYRDGVLASDSRETICGNDETAMVVDDNSVKVFKLRDGRLYGGAQASEDIVRLYEALKAGAPLPKLDDVVGMLIDKRGRIWLYEGNIWQRITLRYYAIGTGAPFAMGAMDAGATAIEAARIGARRDPYSGGKVRHVRL
jgi:hypothetical protein